ncbi:TIGR03749 family integrating conjugative element protein [Denitromonas iodatirespirans]|uniref:TIGR03749 family integrating conjugative element protein n=1 Tax=Denitromonas iodatirespirans TaxID=2795389 RepID=A0A944D5P5_DENI1|nr:TIGR03749 family integrating conjugative element protein [Denitromonas iodatirespirans]MBT0960335.1 TIGR03749 family integrating conjugative element protein [Denitromonas iodatirespirans]
MRTLPTLLLALLPLLAQAQNPATATATPATPLDTLMQADTSAFPDLGFLPRGEKDAAQGTPTTGPRRRSPAGADAAATPIAAVPGVAAADIDRARRGGTHVLYENRPLPVVLGIEAERVIDLPFVPMIQLPPALEGRLLVQPIENVLYLTAREPFARVRLLVQAVDGSVVLPLDVSAHAGPGTPERLPDLVIHLPGTRPGAEADVSLVPPAAADPDMAELTRFAAQSLYAPPRLIPVSTRVRREQVAPELAKDLVRGGAVEANVLASWCAGKLCVTAVRLSNRGSVPLQLDPAMFRGRWVALTAQHWRLHGAGNAADTTAAYLVSDGRFADAR